MEERSENRINFERSFRAAKKVSNRVKISKEIFAGLSIWDIHKQRWQARGREEVAQMSK